MRNASRANTMEVDPRHFVRETEQYEAKQDEFMRKHLVRVWPTRTILILGIAQLLILLAILGVDLPVMLMNAPRWQVLVGCWMFIVGFIACVSTLHSTRKVTYTKLIWTVVLNIIAGVAAALAIAFNILYSVDPYICMVSGGCNYLWYTYSTASPFYTGEVILGVAFLVTVLVFVILFIKYGVGGLEIFEKIREGSVEEAHQPIAPPGTIPTQKMPATGRGVTVAKPSHAATVPRHPPPQPGMVPRYPPPPPGMVPRYPPPPPGMVPRYPPPPPGMAPRYPPPPPGMMMVHGPQGPMLVPDPSNSMSRVPTTDL